MFVYRPFRFSLSPPRSTKGLFTGYTYTGMCRPGGRDFEVQKRFLGDGYNISNARKLQFCKQPFEIIQGQIAFKNTIQCVNKQTVVLLSHPVF